MTGKDHCIHGEGFGPEMSIEEVDGKDEAYGKQGFITVNDLTTH